MIGAPAEVSAKPEPTSALVHALSLASLGFKIFPLRAKGEHYQDRRGNVRVSDGKTPAVTLDKATSDPDKIQRWLANGQNYGVQMGAKRTDPETGEIECLVAVDIDEKHGKRGKTSFAIACKNAGINPDDFDTFAVETPTGGLHLYYVTTEPIKQGSDVLGPNSGVDVRAGNGFLVGPGSEIDGKPYRVINDAPIASMGSLAAIFPKTTKDPGQVDRTPLPGIDPDRAMERAVEYLKTAPLAIEGEAGDQTTFKVAARLKDLGCTEDQTLFLLDFHWNPRCSPPWDGDDLAAKVAHAFKYGREAPGIAAPEAIFEPATETQGSETMPRAKRSALEVLRWSELKDQAVPEVQWIWKPFFPRVSFGALVSHPGHGKSWLSLQIAVAVATGLPIFGQHTCGPAGAGVLALEDDKHVIHRRLKAIRDGYGFAWKEEHDALLDQNLVALVRARTPLEGLGQAAAAHELSHLAKELGSAMGNTRDPAAILFLDTLNAVHSGDENSNTETRQLAATIFSIGDTLGCSVWALHHLRKTGTGKNATALLDRMNPEQVRGASAIVGSTRAVAQFGWVTSSEAAKAGLDPEGAERRYAILGLTKINDGPLSPWLLIEHQKSNGLMIPTEDGEKALATLRGGNAKATLRKSEALLLDLHSAKFSRTELAARHYPDDPRGADKLKAAISDLRTRQGWVQKGILNLTEEGLKKALELLGRQPAEVCLPGEDESEE